MSCFASICTAKAHPSHQPLISLAPLTSELQAQEEHLPMKMLRHWDDLLERYTECAGHCDRLSALVPPPSR